jgi:multiple antibiotic resistance protein
MEYGSLDRILVRVIHDSLLLLAVINPLGNIPLYDALTRDVEAAKRRRIFNLAVGIAAGMVIFFSLLGDWALRQLFGVSLADFQVAGGILLFIVAARGVLLPVSRFSSSETDFESMALFPLAFPIIVGPGTIAVTILMAQQSGRGMALAAAAVTFAGVWGLVHASPRLNRALGKMGGMLLARILYIFLAAKATSLVMKGIEERFGL